jgi:hypothetical protein
MGHWKTVAVTQQLRGKIKLVSQLLECDGGTNTNPVSAGFCGNERKTWVIEFRTGASIRVSRETSTHRKS